ncbi:hypothetical protein MNBD_GAMMA16-428 [hydrothermal vent metagenome]|uniref:Porin domain-containing protein n=1 Tax=hydrothermal vent metagenome TaxID=652676 RepID=A0A3B0ZA06_9ZZZZ
MNKNLISLAVAAVFAMPVVVSAGTEVYGLAHVSVGFIDNDAEGDAESSSIAMNWNDSNIGFKGSEDLGGGLSAIYQAEVGVDFSGGEGGTGETADGLGKFRNTYLGFSGDWGTAIMGRNETPFRSATAKLDPFDNTVGDFAGVLGVSSSGVRHDVRISNMLAYLSPDIKGFSFQLAYGLDDGAGLDSTSASAQQQLGAMSFAAIYSNGPLYVVGAYQSLFETGAVATGSANADDKATRVGGGYTFGNFTINGLWENVDGGGSDNDHDAYYASGVFAMGSTAFALAYGVADDNGTAADSGASMLSFAAIRSLSKRTKIYLGYTQVEAEKGVLINKNTGSTTVTPSTAYGIDEGLLNPVVSANRNGTASIFMLGVSHKFSSK